MNSFKIKVSFTYFLTLIAFIGIIMRLWYISRPGNLKLPQWNADYTPKIRGTIMDRYGNNLALTVSSSSIFLRPNKFKNKTKTINSLSVITGLNIREINRRINNGTPSFVWLIRQVDKKTGDKIRKLNLRGVEITSEPRRVYPYNELASHLIGFSGIDHTGLTGVEKRFNNLLSLGQPPNDKIKNIILTIDRILQYIVEDELKQAVKKTKSKRGLCIVLQPQTGEILTMAANPSFNLNNFTEYRQINFINPNTTLTYEPGSTFKIFTSAYLLKNQLISAKQKFYCPGKIKIYKHTVECTHPHGTINFRDIIKYSCNVGIIKLSKRIKSRKFYNFLSSLGFGKISGIALPGESKGILRKTNKWSGISKSMISIGYEISVTPLQLISAAGTIANEGLYIQPHILKAITDSHGNIIKSTSPKILRRVFPPSVARDVSRMLKHAVNNNGTGRKAKISGIQIGGKTGTANVPKTNGKGYYKYRYNSSFIGFLPYIKSKLIVLVVLQEPKGAHLGGVIAAPVFKRISLRILQYLNKKAEK